MSHALLTDSLSRNSRILILQQAISELPSASVLKRVQCKSFVMKMSLIYVKINLQVRLFITDNAGFRTKTRFHTKAERTRKWSILSETGKNNEQLCQNSCSLVTPACDYAVAMATLKVVDT